MQIRDELREQVDKAHTLVIQMIVTIDCLSLRLKSTKEVAKEMDLLISEISFVQANIKDLVYKLKTGEKVTV